MLPPPIVVPNGTPMTEGMVSRGLPPPSALRFATRRAAPQSPSASVVLVHDATDPAASPRESNALQVFNKSDLLPAEVIAKTQRLLTSAQSGQGIDELRRAIVSRLVPIAPGPGQAVDLRQGPDALPLVPVSPGRR